MLKIVCTLVGSLVALSSLAFSECSDVIKDQPITSKLATSSTYANLRGSSDSLKVLSKELMLNALAQIDTVAQPASFCPGHCRADPTPMILFTSTPNKFQINYSDSEICKELKKQTAIKPIEFKNRVFNSLDELNTYYSDLTRGYGTDGKELYRVCHSSCSPSYRSIISRIKNSYRMDTEVVCNEARDKSEGMYLLSSSFRWDCL